MDGASETCNEVDTHKTDKPKNGLAIEIEDVLELDLNEKDDINKWYEDFNITPKRNQSNSRYEENSRPSDEEIEQNRVDEPVAIVEHIDINKPKENDLVRPIEPVGRHLHLRQSHMEQGPTQYENMSLMLNNYAFNNNNFKNNNIYNKNKGFFNKNNYNNSNCKKSCWSAGNNNNFCGNFINNDAAHQNRINKRHNISLPNTTSPCPCMDIINGLFGNQSIYNHASVAVNGNVDRRICPGCCPLQLSMPPLNVCQNNDFNTHGQGFHICGCNSINALNNSFNFVPAGFTDAQSNSNLFNYNKGNNNILSTLVQNVLTNSSNANGYLPGNQVKNNSNIIGACGVQCTPNEICGIDRNTTTALGSQFQLSKNTTNFSAFQGKSFATVLGLKMEDLEFDSISDILYLMKQIYENGIDITQPPSFIKKRRIDDQ